ncbi:hypothetical protein [Streptomyces sp. NPDC057199]|uniref:hypothetical protein n=1 Tax=Streptomyces sp. NPDC057199 TaxID=3346047 RepID=UPI00362A5281
MQRATATPARTPIQRATTPSPRQRPLLGAPLSAPPANAEPLSGRTSPSSSGVAGPPTVQRAATARQGTAPDRTPGPPATRIHGAPTPVQAAAPPHYAPPVPLRTPAANAPAVQRATAIPSGAGSPVPDPTTQRAPATLPLLAAGAPVRSLTPARALAPVPTPAAPAAGPRRATPVAVPLRRASSPGSGPAVQRAVAPSTPVGRAVPLLSATTAKPGSGATLPVVQRHASTTASAPVPVPAAPIPVQRDTGGPPQPTPARTTTAVSTVSAHGTSSRGSSGSGSASDPPSTHDDGELPPGYTPVAKGQLDPRSLTDFQLDELTHRLIGRITRLVRTELRLDRERIGKLRDPRR